VNFLGFFLLWFCFSCVWILLAPRDGTNLWRSRIKEDSLQKLNTFLHIVFYLSCSLELGCCSTMDALKGRMPKMQGFKFSGCGSTICFLRRSSIVGELELDRSVVL
jgi:hypothetical protein